MNDLKLGDSHPATEELKPIKVGGQSTALEVSKDDVRVNNLYVNGTTSGVSASDSTKLPLAGGTMTGDITTDSDIISTNLTINDAGTITLDSATGGFEMKGGGTTAKFADMYAGMILGYTRIANDQTGSTDALIALTGTMTVLQTTNGTNVGVTFVAPPSGNVEIQFSCNIYTSSTTVAFALSDNTSFNEVGEAHTYDQGSLKMDETDNNTIVIPFAVTGLTAGTSYTYYIGAEEIVGSTAVIYHGRFRSTGKHYPPIIVKAIALPATITTGE